MTASDPKRKRWLPGDRMVGIGGTYNWAGDMYSLYGEVSANTSLTSFADSYSYNGTAGVRVRW